MVRWRGLAPLDHWSGREKGLRHLERANRGLDHLGFGRVLGG